MRNRLLILLFLTVSTLLFGQKVYFYGQLNAMRLEDGRVQYKDRNNNKPLKGQCKVIESYRDKENYYLTNYKNGFKEGKDLYYRRGCLELETSFKGGILEGSIKEFFTDGSIKREANFKNGELEGKDVYYFSNGDVSIEMNYKEGVHHGKELSYDYNTHKLKNERYFYEGKLDGIQNEIINESGGNYRSISIYDRGEQKELREYHLPEETLRKERLDGKEKVFRKNGTLEAERFYVGQSLNGEQKTYYENGNLEKVTNYKKGYRHGPWLEYFPDGKIKLETEYDNDNRKGLSIEYYPNGQKSSEWTYNGFRRTGPYKIYYDNGVLNEEGEMDHDEYVYRKMYYKNGKLRSYWILSSNVLTEIESYDENGKQK